MDRRRMAQLLGAWVSGRTQRARMFFGQPMRRVAMAALLVVVLLSGVLFQLAQTGLVGSVHAASITANPNTLASFLSSGDAAGNQRGTTPTYRAPDTSQSVTANLPGTVPPSVGAVTVKPITTTLGTSDLTPSSTSSAGTPTPSPTTDPATTPSAAPSASPTTTIPTTIPTTTAVTSPAQSVLASTSTTTTTATPSVRWVQSADGALEVGIPSQAVDLSRATTASGVAISPSAAASGAYAISFSETEGSFVGTLRQIAQFSFSVVDAQGHALNGVQFATPLHLRLHYSAHELDGLNLASLRLVWAATAVDAQGPNAASTGVAAPYVVVTADTTTQTLTTAISTLYPGPLVLTASQTDANQVSSEHLTNAGNQGDLSFTYPFDVPAAPGGVTPNLQLVYSSGGPNGRTSPNAPAPEVGDGWSLTLGSISYDASLNMYYLNDVNGVSDPLLCCAVDSFGNSYYIPHHNPQVRIRVQDNSANPDTSGKCFYVYTPDGLKYQMGCTSDSLRFSFSGSGSSKVYYEWDVNKVQRTDGSALGSLQSYTVSYWVDNPTDPNAGNQHYVRDAGPKGIDYNTVNNGGSPATLARVLFSIHWPESTTTAPNGQTATTYGTNHNCNSTPSSATTLRCDDPITPSGWGAAPLTQSTLTLDAVTMQVNAGTVASPNWQTVRSYALGYNKDFPYTSCWFTGVQAACAGDHTLASITETPYQGGTAQPSLQPVTFNYTYLSKNEYHDTTYLVSGNPYDMQTWWQYLNGITDKQSGLAESVHYAIGYGNTHGVNSGSVTDPTRCDTPSNCSGSHAWPDDRQWPRHLVTSISDTGVSPSLTTNYTYTLNAPCGSGCTQDTWIPPASWNSCGDTGLPPQNPPQTCLGGLYGNYYNEVYTGFLKVTTTHPDSSSTVDVYNAGNGWGTNDWDYTNENLFKIAQSDTYQGAPTGTPLQEVVHAYTTSANYCPTTNGGNNLFVYPYQFCESLELNRSTYFGGSSTTTPAVPKLTESWTYAMNPQGPNRFLTQVGTDATTTNDGLADSFTNYGATQPTFTTTYAYVFHDGAIDSTNYLQVLPAQVTLDDSAGNRWSCTQNYYDGATTFAINQYTGLTDGLLTRTDKFSDCGNSSNSYTPSGAVTTGTTYDIFGNGIATTDADANASVSGHTGCSVTGTVLTQYPAGASTYTTCTNFDATQHVYATSTGNALNQQGSTTWDYVQGTPLQSTDANGAVTTNAGPFYEYSSSPHSLSNYLDTYTQTTLPGETYTDGGSSPWTTRVYAYSFCATDTNATRPCAETDTVSQLDGTDLLVARKFYDRDGRLVETRTNGPDASTDVVTYTAYDDVNDKQFDSQACSVAALTASNGGAASGSTLGYIAPAKQSDGSNGAYINPATTCTGTNGTTGATTYRDALGRTIASDDAMGTGTGTSGTGCTIGSAHHTTCTSYAEIVASSTAGLPSSDNEPYTRTLSIDANLHQSATFADASGNTAYTQAFTGASQQPLGSGVSSYAVASYQYDGLGKQRAVTDAGGHTTTYTYNNRLGRVDSMNDTDLGTNSYTYDANGNMLSTTDPRGSGGNGVTYSGYDGLNRHLWSNTSNTSSGAYVTYCYDSATTCGGGGSNGIGGLLVKASTAATAGRAWAPAAIPTATTDVERRLARQSTWGARPLRSASASTMPGMPRPQPIPTVKSPSWVTPAPAG